MQHIEIIVPEIVPYPLPLDIAVCAEILTLSREEVEEALSVALLELPGVIESVRRMESVVDLRAGEFQDSCPLQIDFLGRTS
jgi:hypothetical protein